MERMVTGAAVPFKVKSELIEMETDITVENYSGSGPKDMDNDDDVFLERDYVEKFGGVTSGSGVGSGDSTTERNGSGSSAGPGCGSRNLIKSPISNRNLDAGISGLNQSALYNKKQLFRA